MSLDLTSIGRLADDCNIGATRCISFRHGSIADVRVAENRSMINRRVNNRHLFALILGDDDSLDALRLSSDYFIVQSRCVSTRPLLLS